MTPKRPNVTLRGYSKSELGLMLSWKGKNIEVRVKYTPMNEIVDEWVEGIPCVFTTALPGGLGCLIISFRPLAVDEDEGKEATKVRTKEKNVFVSVRLLPVKDVVRDPST